MDQVTKIIKNTGVEVVSNIVNMLLSAVFTFYVARKFGPALYGTYSLVTTFPMIFASLIIFGLDCIIIRDVSRKKEEAGGVLFNAILFQLILIFITSFLIIASMFLLGYDIRLMFMISLFFLFSSVNSISLVNSSVFKAFEKMEYNAVLNTGERILLLIIGIVVVMKFGGIVPLLTVFVAVSLIKLMVTLRLSFTVFAKFDFGYKKNIFKYFLKEGYPIAISSFFTAFRWNVVLVIISKVLSDSDTGFYNAAFKIMYPLLIITFAYSTAILPVMSISFKEDDNKFYRLYRISCKFAATVSIPVAILIAFFSSQIIALLFGSEFFISANVLKIIIWILPFSFFIYPLGNMLVAMNHQKMAMKANGVNAVILLLAEIYLTVEYGLYGACIGIVAAEFILVLQYFYIVTIKYRYIKVSEFLLKPCVSGILMFAVMYVSAGKSLILGAIAGLLLYSGLIYVMKTFDEEDIAKLKESINLKGMVKRGNE